MQTIYSIITRPLFIAAQIFCNSITAIVFQHKNYTLHRKIIDFSVQGRYFPSQEGESKQISEYFE